MPEIAWDSEPAALAMGNADPLARTAQAKAQHDILQFSYGPPLVLGVGALKRHVAGELGRSSSQRQSQSCLNEILVAWIPHRHMPPDGRNDATNGVWYVARLKFAVGGGKYRSCSPGMITVRALID